MTHDGSNTEPRRPDCLSPSYAHSPAEGNAGNGGTTGRKPRSCWISGVPRLRRFVPVFPEGTPLSGAAALLAEVEAAGARLRVEGGRLVATGARLPQTLIERLLASKAGLLAVLAPPGNVRARPTTVDPTCCRYCGGRMPD